MVTGQGGMLVTDDKVLYERAVSLVEHGREPSKGIFYSDKIGYNYKMPAVCAAIGSVQLNRLDELIQKKRAQQYFYETRLKHRAELELVVGSDDCFCNFAYPSVLVNKESVDRDALFARLRSFNIDSRPAFPRQSAMPSFESANTPVSKLIEEQGWNLPTGFISMKKTWSIFAL